MFVNHWDISFPKEGIVGEIRPRRSGIRSRDDLLPPECQELYEAAIPFVERILHKMFGECGSVYLRWEETDGCRMTVSRR